MAEVIHSKSLAGMKYGWDTPIDQIPDGVSQNKNIGLSESIKLDKPASKLSLDDIDSLGEPNKTFDPTAKKPGQRFSMEDLDAIAEGTYTKPVSGWYDRSKALLKDAVGAVSFGVDLTAHAVHSIGQGWVGLAKLAMGEDAEDVAKWIENSALAPEAVSGGISGLYRLAAGEDLSEVAQDIETGQAVRGRTGATRRRVQNLAEKAFQVPRRWAKAWMDYVSEPTVIRDKEGNVTDVVQGTPAWYTAIGGAVIELLPQIIVAEGIGAAASRFSPLRGMPEFSAEATLSDLAAAEKLIKREQVVADTPYIANKLKLMEQRVKGAELTIGQQLLEAEKRAGIEPTKPRTYAEGEASLASVKELPQFKKTTGVEFVEKGKVEPSPYISERGFRVKEHEKTPFPESDVVQEPTYLDATVGEERFIYGEGEPSPYISEQGQTVKEYDKPSTLYSGGVYREAGKVAEKVGEKLGELHHKLPVGKSLEHLDWHLRNLWEGGWKTIEDLTKEEHRKVHSGKGKGKGKMSEPLYTGGVYRKVGEYVMGKYTAGRLTGVAKEVRRPIFRKLREIDKEITPAELGGSGESAASLEAINRLNNQKDMLFFEVNVNEPTSIKRMANTVDLVDYNPGKNKVVFAKKIGDPRLMVLKTAENLRRSQINRVAETLQRNSNEGTLFRQAADKLFTGGQYYQAAKTMKEIIRRTRKAQTLNKMHDWFSVEAPFRRFKKFETGFHVKNLDSVVTAIMEDGMKKMVKQLRDLKPSKVDRNKAVYIAESKKLLKSEKNTTSGKLANWARKEFDNSKKLLHKHGIEVDFVKRIKKTIEGKLEDAIKLQNKSKIEKYTEALKNVEDLEFVSIPYAMWFETLFDTAKTEKKALRIINAKKRGVLSVKQLEKFLGEKVDIVDVMASYYRKLGNDIGIAKIMQAAEKDGLITTSRKVAETKGYSKLPGYESPAFAKWYMHPVLSRALRSEFIERVKPTKLNQATSLVKMLTFDNPLFLGWYNMQQAAMLRGIWDAPGIVRDTVNGYKMIMKNHPEVHRAKMNGLASRPYAMPFEEFRRNVDWMEKTWNQRMYTMAMDNVKFWERFQREKGFARFPLIPDMYTMVWDAAWNWFDLPVRMGSYSYLRRQGFSPRKAAQTAARYHADYANVPRHTRVKLNKYLYTPSFKIAMGGLYTDMIRAATEGKARNPNLTIGRGTALAGVASVVLTNYAFDKFLTSGLGFKREFFGRRYKKQVETDKGLEDFYITLSSPMNLPLKMAEKFGKAVSGDSGPEVMSNLLSNFKYEITPLLVYSYDIAKNSTPNGAIYDRYEDRTTKIGKSIAYFTRQALGFIDRAFPTDESKRIKKAFAKEVNFGARAFLSTISYQYLTDMEQTRLNRKMKRAQRDYSRSIRTLTDKGKLTSNKLQEITNNYLKTIEEIVEDMKD